MRKFLARASLAMALMLVASMLCSVACADEDVIKVGVFNCLTGQNAFGGQLELEGTQLAHSLNPEILGKKVELIIVDNKSDKVESANAVTRLIENDKVNAIIGTYGSSLAMAGGEAMINEIREVNFDRPFVYCIFDAQTYVPVFIGAVNSLS